LGTQTVLQIGDTDGNANWEHRRYCKLGTQTVLQIGDTESTANLTKHMIFILLEKIKMKKNQNFPIEYGSTVIISVFVPFIFISMTQNLWNLTFIEMDEVRHTHHIIIIIIIIISLQQNPSR
jgi:hypothetical protein